MIPFGLRLSSEDAAQVLQQRCCKAWDAGLMEVILEGFSAVRT